MTHQPIFRTLAALVLMGLGQLYFQFRLPQLDAFLFYAAGIALFWSALGQLPRPDPIQLASPTASHFSLSVRGEAALAIAAFSLIAGIVGTLYQGFPVPPQVFALTGAAAWFAVGVALDPQPLNVRDTLRRGIAWLRTRDGGLLVFIVLLGAALRLNSLDSHPAGFWFDEARIGLEGQRILTDPAYRPFNSIGTTTPAAYIYLVALAEAIFGQTVFAVRLVPALAGIVAVPLSYIVGRQLFSASVGLIAALLMAFSRWDITFSRIGMQGVTTPTLLLLGCALFLWALRSGRPVAYASLGIALGGMLWFYTANVLFPILLFAILGALLLLPRLREWRSYLLVLGLLAGGIVAAAAPIVADTLLNPDTALSRPDNVSVFKDKTPADALPEIRESARLHLLMFNVQGDANGRHNLSGAPMLDALSAVLLVLGIICAFRYWTDVRAALLLGWWVIMLLPGILSLPFEAPQGLRSIGALAPALLLGAWSIERLSLIARGWLGPQQLGILASGSAAIILMLNVGTYWGEQRTDFRSWAGHSMQQSIVGRRVAHEPADSNVLLSVFYQEHPTVRFFDPRPTKTLDAVRDLPLRTPARTAIFIAPEEESSYRLIKLYYPNAACSEERENTATPVVVYACIIDKTDVAPTQGWAVQYLQSAGGTVQSVRQSTMLTGELAPPTDLPPGDYVVEATGSLYAPAFGKYTFALEGSPDFQMLIDDQPVVSGISRSQPVELAEGLHQVRLLGSTSSSPATLRVLWQPVGENLRTIGTASMFRGSVRPLGLTASYVAGKNPAQVGIKRIEGGPSTYFHVPPLDLPFTTDWNGSLFAPDPGIYHFTIEAISTAELLIDGKPVVSTAQQDIAVDVATTLTAGWHKFQVHYYAGDPYSHVYVRWTPPKGRTSPIPPENLRPW